MDRRILNPTYSLFKRAYFFRFQLHLLFGFPLWAKFPQAFYLWTCCCVSKVNPWSVVKSSDVFLYPPPTHTHTHTQMTTSIRGCQTKWSLISIYIFNVNQPWLCNNSVKIWHTFLCPLCSKYNSGWIIFICGTNDHKHDRVCHMRCFLTLNTCSHLR